MAFTGQIGHLTDIESPWLNAGGVAYNLMDVEMLAKTGVGAIEVTSTTLEERTYVGPHYFDAETGTMFNRREMPNCGIDELVRRMPQMLEVAHAHKKPLIVNVATVSSDPVHEAEELVRRAYEAKADAVLLNPECTNVGGSMDHNTLNLVVRGIAKLALPKPIFIRVAPRSNYGDLHKIYKSIEQAGGVSAVFVSNSEKVDQSPIGPAGVSGPAMDAFGLLQLKWAGIALKGSNIDLVSCIGIKNATALQQRLDSDAVAGSGTTFFYESDYGWAEDTDKMLTELSAF